MSNVCVIFGGQPPYYVCDCFYLHGNTGGRDSVDTTVFVRSPSTFLDREAPTRSVPCD